MPALRGLERVEFTTPVTFFVRKTKRRGESMAAVAECFGDDPRVRGYMLGQKHALQSRYGEDLHARSHGESFLNFFRRAHPAV